MFHTKGKTKNAYILLLQLMRAGEFSFKNNYFISSISTFYKAHKQQLQSLPFNVSTVILFYNKTAFDKVGFSPSNMGRFSKNRNCFKSKKSSKYISDCGWGFHGHHFIQTGAYHNKLIVINGNGIDGFYSQLIVNSLFFQTHFKSLAMWYQKGWLCLKSGPDAEKAFAEEEPVFLQQNSNRLPLNIEKMVNEDCRAKKGF